MASGDLLATFKPQDNEPPASAFATLDTRADIMVLDFDASSDEEAVFTGRMTNYDGGGVTVKIFWMATSATSGNVVWQAAFRSFTADADDLDTKSFAAFNGSGAQATASATGEHMEDTITFTDGADMDSVANGEWFHLKIRRDADDTSATDSMTGDAELVLVEVTET